MRLLCGLVMCVMLPATAAAQWPFVRVDVTSCRLTLSEQPPDATTGWRVQFRRGTGTSIGTRDSIAPYEQASGALAPGAYEVWGEWTKSTGSLINSAKRVVRCEGSTSVPEVPWVLASVPPPPPVSVPAVEWTPSPDSSVTGYQIEVRAGAAPVLTLPLSMPAMVNGWHHLDVLQMSALPVGAYSVVVRSWNGQFGPDSVPVSFQR